MSNTGVPYEGEQLKHYEDCMRLVPALAKARAEGRSHDYLTLMLGMANDFADRGLGVGEGWSILAVAALGWTAQTFDGLAKLNDEPVATLLNRAIAAAHDWTADAR